MMNLLTFDTSTDACSAAILTDTAVCSRFEIAPRRHNQLLLNMIDAVLKEAKITCKELNAIAFGNGPGSFMGLRLATGMAQGLAFGANIPVIPISSLQILAQNAYIKHRCQTVVAAWDARMNQLYWGKYQLNKNKIMEAVDQDRLSNPDDRLMTTCLQDDSLFLAGNAWSVYREKINAHEFSPHLITDAKIHPDAKAIIPIATFYFEKKIRCIAADKAEPQYLRNDVAKKK